MAGANGEEKCIGRLTLDISDVDQKVKDVNEFLSKIGTGVDIGDKLSKSIKKELESLVEEAKKAGMEAQKALANTRTDEQQKDINRLIELYRTLYKTQADLARAKGDANGFLNVNKFNQDIEKISKEIDDIIAKWNKVGEGQGDKMSAEAESAKVVLQAIDQLERAENRLTATSINRGIKETEANNKAAAAAEARAEKEIAAAERAARKAEEAFYRRQAAAERAAQKEKEASERASAKAAIEEEQGALEALIQLYLRKIDLDTKATKAISSGFSKTANLYIDEEARIEKLISDVAKIYPELDKWAQADQRVAKAELERNAAVNNAKTKSENEALKEREAILQKLVGLYVYKNQLDAEAIRATASGNMDNVNLALGREQEIEKRIADIAALYPELDKLAQANDKVADAEMRRQKVANDVKQKSDVIAIKEQEEAITEYAQKLSDLYEAQAKLNQDLANNRIEKGSADYEDRINNLARLRTAAEDAGAALSKEARQQAEGMDIVTTSVQHATDSFKVLKDSMKGNEVAQYRDKLLELMKAVTDFNNQVASGRLKEGTDEYKRAQEHVERLRAEFKKTADETSGDAKRMVAGMSEVKNAADLVAQSQGKIADAQNIPAIDRMQIAYNNLKTAIQGYKEAEKNKNESSMQFWQQQINAANTTISNIENEVKTLNVDEATRNRILVLIQQAKDAQYQLTHGTRDGTKATTEMGNQVSSLLTRYFSIMAVIRTINKLISSTVEYVSQYYDKMNEIRIITGKTESEATKLGATYRKLAKDMSVSSLDMADAAIYFTRQGLGAEDVETRLKSTTQYAKAANIEFERSAELITAVVNSMDLVEDEARDGRDAAQRVADVFLKIGDNAATSGEEIGTAMQKAAAAAGSFGVEFEWLAASIGAVSETTRQEATSIGTAFNTLIARLHSIRSVGYNSEDETKINDIQKALNNVNVQLLDEEGNWRKMEDIFSDIAKQWDTLDGKTKSYIATTMAGVKQQNVFLALMEDMSQAAEGTSRQQELYFKALDSTGTAQEKYATYTESVAAAQERLNVAQEQFHSMLDANLIKGWYDGLAGFVNMINEGTDAMNGWNIYIPLIIAGVTALGVVLANVGGIATALMAHPVILTIAGITAGVVALTSALSAIGKEIDKNSYEKRMERINARIDDLNERSKSLISIQSRSEEMFEAIAKAGGVTEEILAKYSGTLENISSISPEAADAVKQLKDEFGNQEAAVKTINAELDEYIRKTRTMKEDALYSKYGMWQPDKIDENGDNLGMALAMKMQNYRDRWWGISQDKSEQFSDALMNAYHETDFLLGDPIRPLLYGEGTWDFLPEQVYKMIKELIENGAQSWDEIGSIIWSKLFSGMDTTPDDILNEYGRQTAEEIYNSLSIGMDELEKAGLKYKIDEVIFGGDNKMTAEEYKNMGHRIVEFLYTGIDEQIDDTTIAKAIANKIFGSGAENIFEAHTEEYIKAFIDSYQRILNSGFSEKEIKKLISVSDIPESEYSNLYEIFSDRLMSEFKDAALTSGLEQLSDKFEGLDLATRKFVYDYMNMGVDIKEINDALADSKTIDEFKQKLKDLYGEIGKEPEKPKSISEVFKDIKASVKEVQALDEAIKSIQKDGEKGINYGDIFDLADTHPELLMVIDDTERLLEVLQKIRDEKKNNQRNSLKEAILDSKEAMQESVFGTSGFETLRQYRDTLEAGSTEAESFDLILEEIIDKWIKMNEKEETAKEEAKETLKSFTELIKEAKESVKDIQAIDQAIKDIKDGKIDSYSDLLGLAESHPEIWTAIQDTKKLAEVLEKIKKESEQLERTKIANVMLNAKGGTKGTQYEALGYETLAEVRNSLADDEEALMEFDAMISASVDEWINLNENTKETEKDTKAAAKSMADAMKEAQQQFNNSVKEVETLDKAIEKLRANKKVDFSDIINLSTAHPEIIAFASDTEKLIEILEKLKTAAKNDVKASIKGIMLDSEDFMANSKFANTGYKTLREYINSLQGGSEEFMNVSNYIDESAQNIVDASKETEKAAETWLEAQAKIAKINSEVKWAKANNFVEQIGELERAYERGGGAAALNVWKEYDEEMRKAIANEYPDIITALAEVEQRVNNTNKAHDEQIEKIRKEQEELFKLSNVDLNSRPVIDSRKLGEAGWDGDFQEGDLSTVYSTSYHAGTKEGADMAWNKDVVVTLTPILENGEVMSPEAVEKYLEELFAQSGDINELMANDKAGKGILIDVTAVGDTQSFEEAQEAVNKLMIRLHELQERLYGAKVESADLGTALSNGAKYANFSSNAFEKTGKAIKQLREGTISATDAYDTFTGEVNNVTKAYEEILAYQEKLAYNQSLTAKQIEEGKEKAIQASDVDTLAKLIGKTTDEVLADFPAAVAAFDELTGATGELKMMLDELNKAAFIRITGTSEADFSNLENGMFAVRADAEELIKLLEATGQWKVETVDLPQTAMVWNPDGNGGGVWKSLKETGSATVLKPTGNNPFARKSTVKPQVNTSKDNTSKSRGGGGGGSNKNNDFRDKNTNTEVERMLDMMSQVNAIQQSQQNYYQTQQKYYSQGGMIQGVIAYMQREQDVLKNQNVTLEANVKEIERYMAAKRAELSQLSTSDENYKDVADDLDKLQKAHQNYTKQLIDNKTAIEALTQSMDEQRKKIRTMEINLRNLILKAIEDREKKKKDMLNAEIQMENTIFNLIKRRYEVERDEILETNQMRIDALQQEKDLLSQQLQLRKEQADAEDKAAKLRELEVKYQRILADPTRKKEAQSIKTEIDALRKEMAWDLAENEVKAQQDAIDQQITSLEDYAEYVTNYYEDLFEHPKKLIEEMRNIMVLSQTEIIEWLKANDETYREASENTQLQMVNGWTETYNEMKGILIDYWEEVEEIIAQGDNYIIEFLKNNSSEYAKAGKLQAEAYVEEWMKQLEDLHNAYKSVTADVASDYDTIQQYTGSASSSKSSGGGGGSGSSSKTNTTETPKLTSTAKHGYAVSINGNRYNNQGYESESAAANAAQALISSYLSGARLTGDELKRVRDEASRTLVVYGNGGEADFTGPAWLDGSKELPERILSPYQTQLFNTMVEALERMSRISVMPAPNMGGLETTGANPVSVGDIIVNVENLDTDDDYEELANKVSDVLMDRIGRTAVVGGLRIRST